MGDQIKKTEMGRAISMYWEEVHTEFWWGTLTEGDHIEDPGVDRIIILKQIFEKWGGRHGLDDLAQDKDRFLRMW